MKLKDIYDECMAWKQFAGFDRDPDFKIEIEADAQRPTTLIKMRYKHVAAVRYVWDREIDKYGVAFILERMFHELRHEFLKREDIHYIRPSERMRLPAASIWEHYTGIRKVKVGDTEFTRIIVSHKGNRDITVIFWDDGTKTKLVKEEADLFSIPKAVAIGQMIKRHGSNSAYKNHVDRTVGDFANAYDIVALYEAGKIYGGQEAFRKRIDEKLEWGKGYPIPGCLETEFVDCSVPLDKEKD